jgi:uncharacterized protein with PIN domain
MVIVNNRFNNIYVDREEETTRLSENLIVMKTKRIIYRFSLLLIALFSLCLHSCEREEWCADCKKYKILDFNQTSPIDTKTICANSLEECEEKIENVNNGHLFTFWHCSKPYQTQ